MSLEADIKIGKSGIETESDEDIKERIIAEFKELGISECPPAIINHFFVLEKYSRFNHDSRMIQEGLGNVIDAIGKKDNGTFQLTPEQKREGALAAHVHDIGKSSSSEDPKCQLAVVRLFSAKTVRDPNQAVSEVIEGNFPGEAEEMLSSLLMVEVTPQMTMRAFWDKHAFWTKEILDRFPEVFSERTKLVAASHHINRGINPCGIDISKVPDESQAIGALEEYVDFLEERVLMAIDQYQAMIGRSEATHEKAMGYLRNSLKSLGGNVMATIIDTIDELGSSGALFPETQKKNLVSRQK